MKRTILVILTILCAGVFELSAQNVVKDTTVFEEYFDVLPAAKVSAKGKKKIKKYGREWREKYRLVYNFNKVYPYALVGRKLMAQVDSTIEADALDRRNRDRYIKNVEKELFSLFEQDIRNTTISQGFLLTRLVDRECGMTVYDIIYNAPVFNEDGTYKVHPYVTVIQNGVVLQNHTEIWGTTEYIGWPQVKPHGDGPILLQSHGDPSAPISYRNIWIRPLAH